MKSSEFEGILGATTSKRPPLIGKGVSTLTPPVNEPSGTSALRLELVATTGTATLLAAVFEYPVAEKATRFFAGSELNPVPSIVTISPALADAGHGSDGDLLPSRCLIVAAA